MVPRLGDQLRQFRVAVRRDDSDARRDASRVLLPNECDGHALSRSGIGIPNLTHEESDAHWRDKHAPLALEIHEAMSHYMQLSVLHCFKGTELDGIALCGFDSLEDLKVSSATPEAKALYADGAKIIGKIRTFIVEEKQIVPQEYL